MLMMSALLVSTALALMDPTPAPRVVVERLGDHTVRYFASPDARENALPSYAIENDQPGQLGAEAGAVQPVFLRIDEKPGVRIEISPDTSLYGTGEVPGQLRRNGRRTTCWNTDAYGYDDDAPSLYQSHPWVLAVRADGTSFGVLADTTYRCVVDTGYADPTHIEFVAEGPEFPVVVIEGVTPQDVLKSLANLTGKMPMPPKWALGYHQCRYSYYPDSRAREIARGFRERDIPCDVLWFDIDYMEAFRVFTFDRGYFPDPKALNEELLSMGFHNVWMIDPGMKSRTDRGPADRKEADLAKEPQAARDARARELETFASIMASGRAADVFVKRANGEVYEGEVWPGWCHYPDFTTPHVRQWWAGLYTDFMANGISGVWNDMNEPAVFNVSSKTMPLDNRHAGDPAMKRPSGLAQGDAAAGDHARYHNVYGMQMIRGTREGIARATPEVRPFVLSRANYIGGHRYGATWTGDNTANWYHLESSIPMVLNVGLSGQPFSGPDLGGFAGNGDGALFARWMGFGALLPFARGHTGKENIDKEPWSFTPDVEEACRLALQRRMRLMPYLYTLFREAHDTGLPVARPTFFADLKDPALRSEDDSFLLGSDLLVVANVIPDSSRAVVMPKGPWREVKFRVPTNTKNTTKGWDDHQDVPRLFVRPGAIIPTGPVMNYVDEKPLTEVTLIVNLDDAGSAIGTLYEDAGDGHGCDHGEFRKTTLRATKEGGEVKVHIVKTEGSFAAPEHTFSVRILNDEQGTPSAPTGPRVAP